MVYFTLSGTFVWLTEWCINILKIDTQVIASIFVFAIPGPALLGGLLGS